MTLSEASEYIAGIPRFAKKTKPENTKELMRRLGNPEDSFRVIHIAGTNGKGSVSAFLESILRTEGFRTGLFTSPHLVSVRERFQIQREEVPEGTFLRAFRKVLDVTGKMIQEGYEHPAYFEFLFAMGMLIFQEEKIDVLVMETGLGGRLDATNCVRHPNLTVITSISFDHMEYLGSTLIGDCRGESRNHKTRGPGCPGLFPEGRVRRERSCFRGQTQGSGDERTSS